MKRGGKLLIGLVIIVALTALTGCSSDSGSKIPKDATVISDEDYDAYLTEGSLTEIEDDDKEVQKLALDLQYEEDTAEIERFIADTGIDPRPDEPNVDQDSVDLEILPDENVRHSVTFNDGSIRDVITLGWKASIKTIADGIRVYPERDNQLGIYRSMYEELGRDIISELSLPDPDEVETDTDYYTGIRIEEELNDRILGMRATIIENIEALPYTPPGGEDCSDNMGTGEGSDRDGCKTTCGFKPGGIFLNHDWNYKEHLTCVKDQANRGTCCAFGVVSATEYWVSRKSSGEIVPNLSEQALYNRMKLNWVRDDLHDGYYISDALDNAISEFYLIPFEYQWNYNPSLNRTDKQGGGFYHSCDNYNEACSNTSHQSEIVCNSSNQCSYHAPENPGNQGFRIKSAHVIWDWNDKEKSFWRIILYLAFNDPVIIQVPVLDQFDDAHEFYNGYVHYIAGDVDDPSTQYVNECTNRGNHIMHVVSFINNGDLPDGAPEGSGGGYIIVKNSWSNCWGDGGYVYLPYDFVREYTQYGSVLTGIYYDL